MARLQNYGRQESLPNSTPPSILVSTWHQVPRSLSPSYCLPCHPSLQFWGILRLGPGLHGIPRLWELDFPDPCSQPHISIPESVSSTRPLVLVLVTGALPFGLRSQQHRSASLGAHSGGLPLPSCRCELGAIPALTLPQAQQAPARPQGQGRGSGTGHGASPPLPPNPLLFHPVPGHVGLQ